MKQKTRGLSQSYAAALRKYLKHGSRAHLHAALQLGRKAVLLKLETLELARIHEQAFINLDLPHGNQELFDRAQLFFTEAIIPIVATHHAARASKVTLHRLNEMLTRSTLDLAASNRQLKQGVVRRKVVEAALKKNGRDYAALLKESVQLQEGFRQLTHQVLSAQEEERKKISHQLQNEIAQTLLGINVRLHSLKQESQGNTKGFRNEIASTQRLVVKSAASVRGVAKRLGKI